MLERIIERDPQIIAIGHSLQIGSLFQQLPIFIIIIERYDRHPITFMEHVSMWWVIHQNEIALASIPENSLILGKDPLW